ncbi:hypothetical protein NUSPORA_00369 [Nucleospora cyclopteri]
MEQKTIGISNLPNLMHNRYLEKGCTLNIMLAGSHGLGKTTFINSFLNQKVLQPQKSTKIITGSCRMESFKLEIIENNFKINMEVIEVDGIGDSIDNTNCHEPIVQILNDRFEDYSNKFNNTIKSKIEDNRIHICLYFLEPIEFLKKSDAQVIEKISEYCNVIPIVAKSDLLDKEEIESMRHFFSSTLTCTNINNKDTPVFFLSNASTFNGNREYPWGALDVNIYDFYTLRQYILEQSTINFITETEYLYDQFRIAKMALEVIEGKSFLDKFDSRKKELENLKLRIKSKRGISNYDE